MLVLAEPDERESRADERRRIGTTHRESTVVRVVRAVRIARRESRISKDDQRLAVVRFDRQQRLDHVDRRLHVVPCE